MATVTGYTAAKMDEIADETVVSGEIVGNNLILTTRGGTEIDAGEVLANMPDASETVRGAIELATVAEAAAMTDHERAVTPLGLGEVYNELDARIGDVETSPGTKVQIITPTAETDDPSFYPTGISMFSITTGSGWSLNGGVGMVLTHNVSSTRCHQTFHINGGTGIVPRRFARAYHSGSGGWSSWHEMYMGPLTIMNLVYPVGSVYMATVSTNPATLLGIGTWTAIQGRFLVGVDGTFTNGSTGGAANKTLATGELPSHTHSFSATSDSQGTHTHSIGRDQDGATGSVERVLHSTGISGAEQVFSGQLTSDGAHTHSVSGTSGATGSGTAFSILPPYFAVYMWRRTA